MGVDQPLGAIGRWCLDTSPEALAGETFVVEIYGWLVLDSSVVEVDGPGLIDAAGAIHPLTTVDRPDVAAAFPTMSVRGFQEVVDFAQLVRAGGGLEMRADGVAYRLPLDLPTDAAARGGAFEAIKARKQARLLGFLACPKCQTPIDGFESLTCSTCGYVGENGRYGPELLPDDIPLTPPLPPFSAHAYDEHLLALIASLDGSLLLDAGAGLRYNYLDDVVNLEIDAFPSTDVVGSAASIPFQDATFDGVIANSVLEHVPDARRVVAELARVAKPGAVTYVSVPFLQPYHGYPHHYFNATRDGLRTLFEPYFEIDELYTPYAGHPILGLQWMLDRYRSGLPGDAAEHFGAMTVDELIATEHKDGLDYVGALSPEATHDLAAWNLLRGRRRAR
jgi:SAM-dependent methyltransferase